MSENYMSPWATIMKNMQIPYLVGSINLLVGEGLLREVTALMDLAEKPLQRFMAEEIKHALANPALFNTQVLDDVGSFSKHNMKFLTEASTGAVSAAQKFLREESLKAIEANGNSCLNMFFPGHSPDYAEYLADLEGKLKYVIEDLPDVILGSSKSFGIDYDDPRQARVIDDTPRHKLYEIFPVSGESIDESLLPAFFVPPAMLGPGIMAFNSASQKSFFHAFPGRKFVKIPNDIQGSKALREMSLEELVADNAQFARKISDMTGQEIAYVGYCGGTHEVMATCCMNSLEDKVGQIILGAAPVIGSLTPGFSEMMEDLPERFTTNQDYMHVDHPDGTRSVCADQLSLIMKLRSLGVDNPVSEFLKVYNMTSKGKDGNWGINKTAARVLYWLTHERVDLPLAITELAQGFYTGTPDERGVMDLKIDGQNLDLSELNRYKRVHAAYAVKDLVVTPASTTELARYADVELVGYPGGHVAMLVSYPNPNSKAPLNGQFISPVDGRRVDGLVKRYTQRV